MSDKKKSELSVMPEFVSGEQPTAAKLNSVSSLMKRAAFVIEKSLGDIWGESEPYTAISDNLLSTPMFKTSVFGTLNDAQDTNGRSLDLVNLGRAIGPMSKLNPRMLTHGLSGETTTIIKEHVPEGVYQFDLKYKPATGVNAQPPTFLNSSALSMRVAGFPDSPFEYSLNPNLGRVNSYLPTEAGVVAVYEVDPSSWDGGASYLGSTFNTIPDKNQLGRFDLNISQNSDGVYEITFPAITHQTGNYNGTSATLTEYDINAGATYTLPPAIRAVCGGDYFTKDSGVANTLIPEGMIYLKNASTGAIYADATYYYSNDSAILVEGVELDLNDTYYVLTVGTDITSCIEDLYKKLHEHTHDKSYGEKTVDIKSVGGIYADASNKAANYNSSIPSNFASQYLHRDGYTEGDEHIDNNALRGDLVIGRRTDSNDNEKDEAGEYLGSYNDSYALIFGSRNSTLTLNTGMWVRTTNSGSKRLEIRANDDANFNLLSDGYVEIDASGNIILDNLSDGETNILTDKATIAATDGSNFIGGYSAYHTESQEAVEGSTYNLDNDLNNNGGWAHLKMHELHYTSPTQGLKVNGYTDRFGTLIRGGARSECNVLKHAIALPSNFTFANGIRIYGVEVLWSPGSAMTGDNKLLTGFDNNLYIETSTWSGSSTPYNDSAGSGVCWSVTGGTSHTLNLYWFLDTAGIGNIGEAVFHHDSLIEEQVWLGGNNYADAYYAMLDVRVTIKYRKV